MSRARVLKRFVTTSTDISRAVATETLLTGTGNGPFIELPEFEPLGNPTNLLSVKMPQSSNLSIRHGSLIAMNGDLAGVSSVSRKLSDSFKFQVLQSESAVSLIVGGKMKPNRMNNYTLLHISDKSETWTVFNDSSVVAWTGYGLEIEPTHVLSRWNSVKTIGKGHVLVSDGNKMLEIDIPEHESVFVTPNSLVASTVEPVFRTIQTFNVLPKMPQLSLRWKTPRFVANAYARAVERLGAQNVVAEVSRSATRFKYHINNVVLFVRLYVVNRVFGKPIWAQISGPSKLLVSTNEQVRGERVFTKQEIEDIYRT
ncbi:hypothetical protein PSN45_000169 [Yamadazyma tenuis]|uniref:Altered inheritance of mitochondria protein 24, mitochondrial n=1 Tax=Candida tenuis (strain ATCC 10573 / BCRC 21748 / CBS 615 / JCM 9827 / NBRC 10315 / NRRL Y-1498 / VKM Y-70) TaxID=590646 RepID=G3BB04_CANTC|nr:uncharacterized protein CANTEDRAFT_94387 [Yamadazyma tenuis ATCC 10573]EGV61495.1 hypothetical protein CANTEDRAFT_94387 [Yamadazyma tenuis ATCC 10573]WEJ92714.1 hypothetical protein PSN45_000169 [Yamadazyma tenuis]